MTLTIALPEELETALAQRMHAAGASSREDYLLQLIEDHCALAAIEAVLLERIAGPFVEFTPDEAWKQRIREGAMKRRQS
jgi:hypothetical protein